MATYTTAEIRASAKGRRSYHTAEAKLKEESISQESLGTIARFDVFLSHSTRDAEIVLGVKALLESTGKSVYVDWVTDHQLDRSRVTPATAEVLRTRMQQSASLLYIHSDNASLSRWTPWELGFCDGLHGAVAIFPITDVAEEDFRGQEYLGIYPYVDHNTISHELEVKRSRYEARKWSSWVSSPRSFTKAA